MSSSINYRLDCPSCGAQLAYHAGHPDAAPWTCFPCYRGFWVSELSHEARAMYRVQFHDWGHGETSQALRATVLAEREEARKRGTSTLPEHVGMLSKGELVQVKRWNLHPEFRGLVESRKK